jgi:fructose-1,6-bisphosphatase II / sedoheptulose-1,7-bisphosphatase
VRSTGASVRLIGDGDVAGIIHTTEPATTGIDIYLGSGGAPEGVLAAAALRCIGGQMHGRLILDSEEKRKRADAHGLRDHRRVYRAEDMAAGDVLFAATGITDGSLFAGVRFGRGTATTFSIVTRSQTGTQRWVRAKHRNG